jgi:hypothetical protein
MCSASELGSLLGSTGRFGYKSRDEAVGMDDIRASVQGHRAVSLPRSRCVHAHAPVCHAERIFRSRAAVSFLLIDPTPNCVQHLDAEFVSILTDKVNQ